MNKRGFSLIEILVVVAVLGILLSIGALQLNRMIQQSRMNEVAQTLGDTLKTVASEALASSQTITITPGSTGLSWQDEGGKTGQVVLPYGASLTAKTLSGTTVTSMEFTGRGFPKDGAIAFELSLHGKSKQVSLLATGAVIYP